MQTIWVFAVLALASADVSHLGYNYKVPHTSYGVPSYQVSSSHHSASSSSAPSLYKGAEGQYLGSSFSHGDHAVPHHLSGDAHLAASSLNGGVVSGLYNGANAYGSGSSAGYSSGNAFGFGSGLSSIPYYQTVGGPSTVQPIYLTGSNQYQTTQYHSGEKYQQFYQVQSNEPAQVYKHFYVHSAPEELELPKPRTPIVVPPPQKHYKIIFVKTPNQVSHSSQIVPVQPQNEEKTIVYVLVKKPEEHREVIVPKVEQKPPTKPEVYFIKYNNKEDSQSVINNIVNDYNKPGQSVSYSTGGSEGSPVLSTLPQSDSGYFSVNSDLYDVPTYSGVPIPTGGFSSGFSQYPSSSTFLNLPSPSISTLFSNGPSSSFSGVPSSSVGSTFSTAPSSVGSSFSSVPSSSIGSTFSTVPSSVGSSFSGVPSSLSTGSKFSDTASSFSSGSSFSSIPSSSLSNKFGSSSDSSSSGSKTGSSGSVSSLGLNSGSNSGLSSGSNSAISSVFGSSQSDSSIPAPIVSSSVGSQTFTASTPATIDSDNDAGVAASSVFSGISSPSVSTSNDVNTVSGSQGLPHETYGVPKFRIG